MPVMPALTTVRGDLSGQIIWMITGNRSCCQIGIRRFFSAMIRKDMSSELIIWELAGSRLFSREGMRPWREKSMSTAGS